MMNTFVLILMIITGISGIFWVIKKISIIVFRSEWYFKAKIVQKYKNYFQLSNNVFFPLVIFCTKIYELVSSMFPMLLLIFIIRSFIFEPFQIPSGSMMPTLLIGDFIIVNKFVYGIKSPINQKTLVNVHHPKRGDLIVFKYPKDVKLNYIKRVIGIPGDRIVYNVLSKKLQIYSAGVDGLCNEKLPIVYDNIVKSEFVQIFNKSKNGMVSANFIKMDLSERFSNGIRLIQTTESLGDSTHNILTMIAPGDTNFIQMYNQYANNLISEWLVPEGEYFVMGDNRDNSSDSRYWGYVSERNVVGKAVVIWMSVEKEEGKWPRGLQLNRIGFLQ